MKRLEDLLLQQTAVREAQASTPPIPVEAVAPRGSSPALDTSRMTPVVAPQEEVISAAPAQVPLAGAVFPVMVEGEERERLMDRLNEFRRYSPKIFDGEKAGHWIVEKWFMHMEKLFRDAFMEERDRDNPYTELVAISWKRFKELLLEHYFPDSVKRKMEQDLRGMRQEDRTVAEYEREFSQLLHCVPFVVRDDEDKARLTDQRDQEIRDSGKVEPLVIGPYEILERVGLVAYRLALPPNLSGIHDIFHVSVLRKCIFDPAHVLDATPIELRDDLTFEEQPVRILAREVRKLRNRNFSYVKVLWSNHEEREATLIERS
uniref:Uncharacterized protein n=1 Tax=Ananas comosus var. bracteatus TaxID=296719 RepID=A0A6V7Q3Q1_ANACO|nr:unnamed protein product [Ananas comosus var. bracteatus]